jgi:hypothetical protein
MAGIIEVLSWHYSAGTDRKQMTSTNSKAVYILLEIQTMHLKNTSQYGCS